MIDIIFFAYCFARFNANDNSKVLALKIILFLSFADSIGRALCAVLCKQVWTSVIRNLSQNLCAYRHGETSIR